MVNYVESMPITTVQKKRRVAYLFFGAGYRHAGQARRQARDFSREGEL